MADRGLACLRMYDLGEVVDAVDELWRSIRVRIPDAPPALSWEGDLAAQWSDPALVLGQTCGWPLVVAPLAGRVGVVGAFDYGVIGSGRATYRSVVVARTARSLASFAGSVAAVNGWDSLSGWASLCAAVAPHGGGARFFERAVCTGSHVASIVAIQAGDADLAAIDAVTWSLLSRHRPGAVAGLEVVGHGPRIPTLPLITAGEVSVVRAAVAAAIADPVTKVARRVLGIEQFVAVDAAHYSGVLALAARATMMMPSTSH